VKQATGDAIWTPPTFEVNKVQRTATLAVKGVTTTVAGILAGLVQIKISQITGSTPSILRVNGPELKEKNITRVIQIVSPNEPPIGSSRDDMLLFLAHCVVWKAGCSVYGGFVRDLIINGESATDIDVEVKASGPQEIKRVCGIIKHEAAAHKIKYVEEKQKGAAHTLVFSGGWLGNNIEVDLVDPNIARSDPGVDTDTGNLMINSRNLLSRKQAVGPSLNKIIKHCNNKKFVFLYSFAEEESVWSTRMLKYLKRGWTCITPVPSHIIASHFASYSSLLKGEGKYRQQNN